ncbi:carbon-nitrogen hydrolase [Thioalkalivibrio paradoxus]|uniref:Apolipoprotein acyltransferase n=1 Tax=Thioalkalivibrio paradoxus ARh 1 TaxID=713585 RepID=W0DMU8_9GAMM|nr:carbon-nitrogen hydrolase [Thioalkalivibrio paradoxus]AHE98195.1 apolipoprotein acyltransferase [Thioalkalivibrio paradoxus ARh 1]
MRVALIQHRNAPDRDANLAETQARVAEAAQRGARLVVLAELHTGPYFCQVEHPAEFDRAEPLPGPSTEALAAIAREHRVVLVGSLFERRAPGLYHNTAVVFERDGQLAGRYRKMHIPDDPGYFEKYYFAPGDLGFEPIDTSAGRLGVLVCWDQWYPEAARLMALAGAELLIYPTAIGWDPHDSPEEQARQRDAWITVQRGHAIANNLPVLACNRVGFEPDPSGAGTGAAFWGSSFVTGPQGEFLAQAGTEIPETLHAEIDPGRTERVRRQWPFLRDRRIDAYDGLLRRFRD